MGSKKKGRNQNKARSKKVVESSTKKVDQPSETQIEPTAVKPNETEERSNEQIEKQNGEENTDKQECQNSNEQTNKPKELVLPKETEKLIDQQKEVLNDKEQTNKLKELALPKDTDERTPKQIESQIRKDPTEKLKELALSTEDKQQEGQNSDEQTEKQRELVLPTETKEQAAKEKECQKSNEPTYKQIDLVFPKEKEYETNKHKEAQHGNEQTDKQRELVISKDTDKQRKGQNSNEQTGKQRDVQSVMMPTIEISQTPSELVPVKVPEVIKHPLENKWGFWLNTNEDKKNWAKNQKELTIFDTVEDYWCLYHHMKLPSELISGQDYAVFKHGISPMWEDVANQNGGRWVISLERHGSEMDRIWLDVVLLMIGENFQNGDIISGGVVNVRSRRKISVWTGNKNETANMEIGKKLKSILRINVKINFYDHKNNEVLFYI